VVRRLLFAIGVFAILAVIGTFMALKAMNVPMFVEFNRIPTVAAARPHLDPFTSKLIESVAAQTRTVKIYRDGYYDGGDPPERYGVCTDVVIRSFRHAGVDLQTEVAEDVRAHPDSYLILRPDPNIDHRRTRNLIVFFRHRARELPDVDWEPGDVVFWSTHNDGRVDHVGMIACGKEPSGDPTIIHHWPGLPVSETGGLHRFQIVGHFRWRAG
jgi:uncharacterized protein YijF (DUF1287 family)